MNKKKKIRNILNWDEIPIIFDVSMAQNLTGFSATYIRQMARAGEFPAHKFKGGHWRIDREEFLRWWKESSFEQKR